MKWNVNRGWLASQRWIEGVLWVETLSNTTWMSRRAGTERSIRIQEPPELLGSVAWGHVRDHLPRRHVQCGVEVGGAVADVVMGPPFGDPGHQREHRSGAVQGLDLGRLIDTQHDRGIRRVQIEPDNIADLVDELRVR